MKKKELRLLYTTVVHPNEYDIDKDMEEVIKLSNKTKDYLLLMDVGKVIGLWKAYKELLESKYFEGFIDDEFNGG
jgi:hypothetical protein